MITEKVRNLASVHDINSLIIIKHFNKIALHCNISFKLYLTFIPKRELNFTENSRTFYGDTENLFRECLIFLSNI